MTNEVKINRREFLKLAGAGALALGLAPGLLPAAGRNVAPVPAGNPLFTGAIGRYEGVTIFEPRPSDLRAVQNAMMDSFYNGSGAIGYTGRGARWIPIRTMYVGQDGR